MRVVSGTLRGRRFSPQQSFQARPTTDFAKENLFNVLSNIVDFEEISVLDLFSGSGGITYEFASRGCHSVTCIEKNPAHHFFIKKTTEQFGISDVVKCLKGDAIKFIKSTNNKYDVIFADPPYSLAEVDSLPDIIMNRDILTSDGFFILEHSGTGRFCTNPYLWQTRSYGKVNFSFFRK